MDVFTSTKLVATFSISPALFGTPPSCNSASIGFALPTHACTPPENRQELKGGYVLVTRGGCTFPDKARIIQETGAIGMILINDGVATFPMQAGMMSPHDVYITSAMMGSANAEQLTNLIEVRKRSQNYTQYHSTSLLFILF